VDDVGDCDGPHEHGHRRVRVVDGTEAAEQRHHRHSNHALKVCNQFWVNVTIFLINIYAGKNQRI
jgi:hypothetical protein